MTSPSPKAGRLDGRAISWLALVGLGVVLFAFAALIVGGSIDDARTTREAERSGDLAEAYLMAQDAMSREDEIEDAFDANRDPALINAFESAASRFDAAMVVLRRSRSPRDRRLAARATILHDRYVAAMRDTFDARDDDALIERIDDERVDPAQDALQPLVNGTGPQYAVTQLKALDELMRGEKRELIASSIAVPVGAILYVLLVIMFVRQRRRLDRVARAEVARLDEAAHTDSLTGLLNRRALRRDLAARAGDPRVMAMIDVVGLKPVNDLQGHLAGDALLQGVAAALREAVRDHGRAYRIGGDEFAILFAGGDESVGRAVIDAVRDRVAVRHPAGVRGGVASGTGTTELLERASGALLDARQADCFSRAA